MRSNDYMFSNIFKHLFRKFKGNSNLNRAINTLKRKVRGAKPDAYWIDGARFIFRIKCNRREIGCNYYIVDGYKVIGTNPMISHLDVKDMITL